MLYQICHYILTYCLVSVMYLSFLSPNNFFFFVGDNDLRSISRCFRQSVRPRFVRPDGYLQHQWIFFSDTVHMHLKQSSDESCEISSGSNSKKPTYPYFCLLKSTKYLKMLSVQINISDTNEHFFPILYTCINYHQPMNPMKFYPDQI